LRRGAERELFQTVKIYNAVLPEADGSYREAVLREYSAFCQKEKQPVHLVGSGHDCK
jgi:hypothetical protein